MPSRPALLLAVLLFGLLACTPSARPNDASASSGPAAATSTPSASAPAPGPSVPQTAASAPTAALAECPRFANKKPLPEPGAAPAKARAACAKLVESSKKMVAKAGKEAVAWKASHWEGVGKCIEDAKGAWILDIESFKKSDTDLSGVYRLVRFEADGKEVRTKLHDEFGEMKEGRRAGAELLSSVDVDGDGVFEVMIKRSGYYGGGEDAWETTSILRLEGLEAKEIALPLEKGHKHGIVEVLDLDGDGRLDLIVESPLSVPAECTLDGEARGPRMLLHGTEKGFSRDDAVAKDFARLECAGTSLDNLVLVPEKDEDPRIAAGKTAMAIGCARIAGMSPDAIKAKLREQQPREGARCATDLRNLEGVVDVKPPFTVSGLVCRR
jgi:hypothetical protein